MKCFSVDYSTPTPMATIIFNSHTRRNQKDNVAILPGLKPSVRTPNCSTRCDAILRAMCKTFDVDTEMQVIIFNLLVGDNDAGDWRIVEVQLAEGQLTLCLADKNGTKRRAGIHGSQFQNDSIELKFEGARDELALTLLPRRIRGAYMNDLMNDVFELRSPHFTREHVWYLDSRQEVIW